MAKETKIVTIGEYLAKVPADKPERMKEALKLIYNDNKVIDKLERKGEIYFVVE